MILTYGETMAAFRSADAAPLRMGGTMAVSMAGAESTVAIGTCRLGGAARWVGVVGDDELGRLIAMRLRAEGVLTDGIAITADAPTSLILKERRTAATTRVSYYRRHCAGALLSPEHVREEHVRDAAVLHVTGITPALSPSADEAVRKAVRLARDHGVTVSFDVNHRSALWSAAEPAGPLRDLARQADVLFAGEAEAALLTGARGTPREAALALAGLGPRQVVVKLGAEGALALADGEFAAAPLLTVPERDPVGAGDAFAAGFLADLALGRTAAECLETAARTAAVNVTCDGDWEGLPTRAELAALTGGGDPVLR
ncbi:sugar kinase [Actinomadura sp. NPDC048394]|uniref:sugar kinase n=1 Tax=Actinomadura sp. NPDC048394 TaxID=3158223 RepID=UPI0033FC3CC8